MQQPKGALVTLVHRAIARSARSMYGWVGSDRRSTEGQKMSETRTKEQATCGVGKANWNEAAALPESASDGAVVSAEKNDEAAISKSWLTLLLNAWKWETNIQQRRRIGVLKQQNQVGTEWTTDIGKYRPSGIAVSMQQPRSIRGLQTVCYRCRMDQKWNEASKWNRKKSAGGNGASKTAA